MALEDGSYIPFLTTMEFTLHLVLRLRGGSGPVVAQHLTSFYTHNIPVARMGFHLAPTVRCFFVVLLH